MGNLVQDTLAAVGVGESSAEESRQEQRRIQEAIIARLDKIGIPEVEAQKLILESPELVGELIPELEGYAEQLDPSAFEDIEVSPELKSAQLSALSSLQDRSESGLSVADEAEINEVFRKSSGDQRSADAAIMQNMAERGMLGSGQELSMRRAGGQDARQLAARQAEAQAAMSLQNQIAATSQLGEMATQQRSQEYGEQSQKAQAADAINQANLTQRANVKQRDVASINAANAANLAAAQKVADAGTSIRNTQESGNKALIQQHFQNEMQQAGAGGAAMGNVASAVGQQAAAQSAAQGQTLGAIGTVVGSAYGGPAGGAAGGAIGQQASDVNLKMNVDNGDMQIEELLDNIDAYDYDYVPGLDDGERHTSVMAQDLEKSEVGDRFVEDTEMGKMVDYEKALPSMMAAQGNLNKRLRKLESMLAMSPTEDEGIL